MVEKHLDFIEHARIEKFNGIQLYVDRPENIIINKLLLGTEQDLEDAVSVFVRNYKTLDKDEMELLASKYSVLKEFISFVKETESLM